MLKSILPNDMYLAIKKIPYNSICELRLRVDSFVVININGENFYLNCNGISKDETNAFITSLGLINSIIAKVSNNSFYTINDELIEGYISLDGGIRLGVCGEVVYIDNKIKTIKNISSINFRFPHFVKNCSLKIYPYLFNNRSLFNTLIVSPPGAGKTTLIRDLIYQLSIKEKFLNIMVIDERCEIGTVFDGENYIKLHNIDVFKNCTKSYAFTNGIRSMKPDIIFTDEINIDKDLDCIINAITSGVNVVATIHASNINDLKNKYKFKELLEKKLFNRFVFLSQEFGVGTIEGIFNENLSLIGV